MRVAVQPPEYFPSLAYTALIQHVDHFILADTFRYRRETFQNRSKLRNAQGWHWVEIPLFGQPHGAPLHTVEIDTGGRWREKHWRSFMYDYRTTMYFEFYEDTFQPFFEETWTHLSDCTCQSIELQVELFSITTSLSRASELEEEPQTLTNIVDAVGADTLVCPSDGEQTEAVEAEVQVMTYNHPTYRQNFEGFEAGMSAMDLVFNYGREAPRILTQGITDT